MSASIDHDRWTAVDRHLAALRVGPDDALDAALAASDAAGLPPHGVSPRLRATAIQTVGEKGYDGFALAVVL